MDYFGALFLGVWLSVILLIRLKQKKDGMIFHPFLYRNKFLFLGGQFLYSSKIKFKPRQRRLAVLKYSLRLVS